MRSHVQVTMVFTNSAAGDKRTQYDVYELSGARSATLALPNADKDVRALSSVFLTLASRRLSLLSFTSQNDTLAVGFETYE